MHGTLAIIGKLAKLATIAVIGKLAKLAIIAIIVCNYLNSKLLG